MSETFNKFLNIFKKTEKEMDAKTNVEESKRQNTKSRIHKEYSYRQRKLFLWGFDDKNNPSFLVLYGWHKYKAETNNSEGNELEENVDYTSYAIFRGKDGHFPSFESVKILRKRDYKSGKISEGMYYKKDIKNVWYWDPFKNSTQVEDFKILDNEKISISYFEDIPYEEYVNIVNDNKSKLKFENFTLAKNQNEVLKLDNKFSMYLDDFLNLFSNPSIYLRKKYLKELIAKNPPKEIYDFILKVGSCELISGLFMELALQANNILVDEAKNLINLEINWITESYLNGLKRCATLYIDSFDSKAKEEKINFIKENLEQMDLKIIKINNRQLSKTENLEGIDYSSYSSYGYFLENQVTYDRKQSKYIERRRSDIFDKSYYSDGLVLNINNFKSTIQQCEIYGLSDVLGKIAYYLDAPRLNYYFKGSGKRKSLFYFRRYLRRILDSYAINDENKFIDAMGMLFTSYRKGDYCGLKDNFQLNYFIKHYLYNSFNEKFPYNDYDAFLEWKKHDQFLEFQGRYDFMPQLWNRHLDKVLDIVSECKVDVISKAFYYMLMDNTHNDFENMLTYEKIIKLLNSSYKPLSKMFSDVLIKKIQTENGFNITTMLLLMNTDNKDIHEIAFNYFETTGGRFEVEDIVSFIFSNNFKLWTKLIEYNINQFYENQMIQFFSQIFINTDKFIDFGEENIEILKEIFDQSLNKIALISNNEKSKLISIVTSKMISVNKTPKFIIEFMEKILFSNSLNDVKDILKNVEIIYTENTISNNSKLIISFLDNIRNNNIPKDAEIIEIIETGSKEMIKLLVELIHYNKENLASNFTTLLIMYESNVIALNQIAKSVFEELPKEQQKNLHFIIIDSPDKKTYDYGLEKLYEIYEKKGELIPEDFLVKMLQHSSYDVKSYISNKIIEIINNLADGNENIFMYYTKTLLFLPNKISKVKNNIYDILPVFVHVHKNKQSEVEEMLLDIGNSNIILDSERALVTFAKIKKGAV